MKFIRKLESFTKEKYSFVIISKTKNIRSLFTLKNKTSHVSSAVYNAKCNSAENDIGETAPNVTIRRDEHSDTGKNSEPAKHLNQLPEHRFNWKIFRRVPNKVREREKVRQRKIHKAYYVMCIRNPSPNNQSELTCFTLFSFIRILSIIM